MTEKQKERLLILSEGTNKIIGELIEQYRYTLDELKSIKKELKDLKELLNEKH